MNSVLLDTGPIVALLDRSEETHGMCVEIVSTLEAALVTCEAVIAEACYLLRNVRGAPACVLENVERGNFLVPYRITGRAAVVARLLKKYRSVPMDLADACLVDMASELNTGRIFTLDQEFRVFRWSRNRPFDFIVDSE